jgi:hypothetical protein
VGHADHSDRSRTRSFPARGLLTFAAILAGCVVIEAAISLLRGMGADPRLVSTFVAFDSILVAIAGMLALGRGIGFDYPHGSRSWTAVALFFVGMLCRIERGHPTWVGLAVEAAFMLSAILVGGDCRRPAPTGPTAGTA